MQENSIEFERTHNMLYLLSLCLSGEKSFEQYKPDFEFLDDFSVDIRYPGDFAIEEDARAAIESMKRVREFIRSKLGLAES